MIRQVGIRGLTTRPNCLVKGNNLVPIHSGLDSFRVDDEIGCRCMRAFNWLYGVKELLK